MSPNTELSASHTAAPPNKAKSGRRQEESICCGGVGEVAVMRTADEELFERARLLRRLRRNVKSLLDARDEIRAGLRRILPSLFGEFHRFGDRDAHEAFGLVNPTHVVKRVGFG